MTEEIIKMPSIQALTNTNQKTTETTITAKIIRMPVIKAIDVYKMYRVSWLVLMG